MNEFTLGTWLASGLAALLVGLAKNGLPGLGILVVPLMALAFPARDSIGVLLPLLLVGDVLAIALYRRHAQWRKLLRLLPYVVVGMIGAGFVLAQLDNESMRPFLGVLILALLIMECIRMKYQWNQLPHHPVFAAAIGASAGFATTVGNAAGPIMSLYFLSRNLLKQQFVGTAAWFFFVVNSSKVPLYVHFDLITKDTLLFNATLIPAIGLGAWLGFRLLPIIPQRVFKALILVLAAIAALGLLL